MSANDPKVSPVKSSAGILGVGAAACAACCAGPVLAALSAIGIAAAVGYAMVGAVAVLVGAAAVAWVLHRRRRQRTCAPASITSVGSPTMKPRTPPGDPPGGERTGDQAGDTGPVLGVPDSVGAATEPTPG